MRRTRFQDPPKLHASPLRLSLAMLSVVVFAGGCGSSDKAPTDARSSSARLVTASFTPSVGTVERGSSIVATFVAERPAPGAKLLVMNWGLPRGMTESVQIQRFDSLGTVIAFTFAPGLDVLPGMYRITKSTCPTPCATADGLNGAPGEKREATFELTVTAPR